MQNVKIYLRKHNPTLENGIVWVSFYVNREKINFSTKIVVNGKNWDEKKQCIGTGDKYAQDKNLIIENILSRINNVFVKYRLKDRTLTRDAFLRAYHRPADYDTFFDFVTEYQKKVSAKMEYATLMTHLSVIKKLKEYNSRLVFDDITEDWLDGYFIYLRKELGNNDNTAYKNMSTLRKYVRAAHKAGYMDSNPFENWSIKKTTSNCTYLTEQELQSMVKLYSEGNLEYRLHKTLEFFLFLCFSSLHVGDAKPLLLEQFNEDSFTYFRVKLRNSKPMPIQVPVSEPLRAVLHNIVGTRKKGSVFEVLPADQTMNEHLKEIARIAEIDKRITHKVGRHTFATIFLKKTKDLASLKEILGHSEIKETLVYAHVLDESKQEGIKVFNDFNL
ncbi:Tyrosine recombinase XerD [termite gut metagenome]|uniref:Tyrosine recombinase XerD n=1 Tax=termite gut metagenome TaxID=433724 RepID=A0A5J4SR29_9ZZZZ